jgi:rhodanese-related sulfurtransferase
MPRHIDRDEVQRLMRDGAQLVNVLPPDEYDRAHIPGSISLPLRDMTREHVRHVLRRDKTVVTYCNDFQ